MASAMSAMYSLSHFAYKDLSQFVDLEPSTFDTFASNELTYKNKSHKNQGSEFDENAVTFWLSDEEKSESRLGSSRSLREKKESSLDEALHKIKEEAAPEVLTFDDQFDLGDEAAWSKVPSNQLSGRFQQYRRLTVDALAQYETKVADMVQNTGRKVQNLKLQFQEHKARWERERQLLLQLINQSETQKSEAQGYAERTMEQLELFISDTENQLQKSKETSDDAAKEKADREAVLNAKLILLEMQKSEMEARLAHQELEAQEMATRLLQQTDDAKLAAEELNEVKKEIVKLSSNTSAARQSSHAESARIDSSMSAMRQTAQETRLALKTAQNSQFEDNLEKIKTRSLTDLELDESADAPFPPDLMEDPTMTENGVTIANHPIVQEYLKTYQNLMTFKDNLVQLLLKEEIKAQANELLEMENCNFDKGTQVLPQVENMSKNVTLVLQQMTLLIENILLNTKMTQSRRAKQQVAVNPEVFELQEKYEALRRKLEESEKAYEEKLNANTSAMLDLQSTIGVLRREISSLTKNKAASSDVHSSLRTILPPLTSEPTVIFTRLDSERNARTLKKAHNEMRIDSESYDLALAGMCEYTRLPAQRLAHLAHRFVHENTMRKIADQVRNSGRADPELLYTLDRMEKLEQRRTRRYSQLMEFLTAERIRLANRMVDTFEQIEEQSSIFLIKPILSLQNRTALREYYSLLMQRQNVYHQDTKLMTKSSGTNRLTTTPGYFKDAPTKKELVQIEGFALVPDELPTATFWQPAFAQNRQTSKSLTDQLAMINTPRLLELDINRVLLGQNNVSVTYDNSENFTELSPQNLVRSYVTITRPSAQINGRPVVQDQKIPPTTPQINTLNFYGASKDLTGTPSLPPITPTPRNYFDENSHRLDNKQDVVIAVSRQSPHLSVQ